jgi:hypothetical protein
VNLSISNSFFQKEELSVVDTVNYTFNIRIQGLEAKRDNLLQNIKLYSDEICTQREVAVQKWQEYGIKVNSILEEMQSSKLDEKFDNMIVKVCFHLMYLHSKSTPVHAIIFPTTYVCKITMISLMITCTMVGGLLLLLSPFTRFYIVFTNLVEFNDHLFFLRLAYL